MSNQKIVVDGSNVAWEEQTQDGKPKVSNLVAMRAALERHGFQPVILVDAALHHDIDDPAQLEGMLDKQVVHQAPAGTDADYFVLAVADEHGAKVVSNDQFEPYRDSFGWIEERRVPFMIVNGTIELYEPNLKPDGK